MIDFKIGDKVISTNSGLKQRCLIKGIVVSPLFPNVCSKEEVTVRFYGYNYIPYDNSHIVMKYNLCLAYNAMEIWKKINNV